MKKINGIEVTATIVERQEKMFNNIDPEAFMPFNQKEHENEKRQTASGKTYFRLTKTDWVYMARVAGGAAVIKYDSNGEPVHVVITDDIFDALSPLAKAAVEAHEEGHIECGHLEENIERIKAAMAGAADSGDMRQLHMELEADAYAARKVGVDAMLRMIAEIKDAFDGTDFCTPEFKAEMAARENALVAKG